MKHVNKKIVLITVTGFVVVVLVIGGILLLSKFGATSEGSTNPPFELVGDKTMSNRKDMVTATGYAVYDTVQQTMDANIDSKNSSDFLTIESIKVKVGDTVSKGDVLFTVTKESFEAAKTYLEEQLSNAENKLAQENLDYKQAVLDAEYNRLNDSQLGDTAKVEYEATVKELKEQISAAKKEYDEAADAISDNPSVIKSNKSTIKSYETKLKAVESELKEAESTSASASSTYKKVVTEYKTVLYTYKYLLQLQNSNTVEVDKLIAEVEQAGANDSESLDRDDANPGEGSKPSGVPQEGYKPMASVSSLTVEALQNRPTDNNNTGISDLLSSVKSKCDSLAKTYRTAKSNNETATAKVSSLTSNKITYTNKISSLKQQNQQLQGEYDQAKNNISSLKSKYQELINKQEAQLVTLKKTYELSVLTSEAAQNTYKKTIATLDESLKTYRDAYNSAKENLDNLTKAFSKYQFIANQSGEIASINYTEGDMIMNGKAPIAYINHTSVSVTVAVSQEDIATLSVGDSAMVMGTSSSGRYSGMIKEIASKPSTESMTNATYNVVVQLAIEDGTSISTSDSLSVIFGGFSMNRPERSTK